MSQWANTYKTSTVNVLEPSPANALESAGAGGGAGPARIIIWRKALYR